MHAAPMIPATISIGYEGSVSIRLSWNTAAAMYAIPVANQARLGTRDARHEIKNPPSAASVAPKVKLLMNINNRPSTVGYQRDSDL